ncbi:CDK-activating kinase assembly factor [Aaosphaeria arxii CBS 175.79]|uniref:RNA polymerase II transcription factor B subunit 3 n=1 Tax=Aaosphaeria arxii CBS 175.79 TaxID=1450172 RepID=A0A6A5X9L7_9PLEO|nr:CDK-activating kinase assembly factor [Aaosphaeria arxii CBS 175.79]KAF2009566.1 CDK-activating kinase assembly factor [Aaosphaeria arxii CBS 175.79]
MSTKAGLRAGDGAKDGGASPLSKSLYNLSIQQPSSSSSMSRADTTSDICPVCKSSRYLNPNMQFLLNPECYHKMCESCVDRIFSHGPAPCPIAGCRRTLRKVKFRKITFEDLKVEREVDIRKRVARVLNKQLSDFETLRDYNDYLETAEEVTWNLILGVDVEATNRKLQLWEDSQKAERNPNAVKRSFQADSSTTSDGSHGVVLKKGGTQRKAMASSSGNTPDPSASLDEAFLETGFAFKGLKKYVPPPPEKPFDPYGGWSVKPQLYTLRGDYDVEWLTKVKDDPSHVAGGYDMHEFYSRALCEAFGGLGVFIDEEIPARENQSSGNAVIGTQTAAAAATGAKDVNMDDVF